MFSMSRRKTVSRQLEDGETMVSKKNIMKISPGVQKRQKIALRRNLNPPPTPKKGR